MIIEANVLLLGEKFECEVRTLVDNDLSHIMPLSLVARDRVPHAIGKQEKLLRAVKAILNIAKNGLSEETPDIHVRLQMVQNLCQVIIDAFKERFVFEQIDGKLRFLYRIPESLRN